VDASNPIWFRPERSRRGPRPTLGRNEITQCAIELADSEGLDAVSMRRIAARLGSGATSLYWYISSKDDLFELMVDEVVGEIAVPDPSEDWRADVQTLAHNIHATLRKHQWMVLLGIRPVVGPKTRAFGERALRMLDPLKLDQSLGIQILAALNNYLYGFVHRELAWEQVRGQAGLSEDEWSAQLRDQVDRARAHDPGFAEPWEARVALTDQDSFEFGLGCLLDGFEVRTTSKAAPGAC
jgi:AcrR family transcriptional regulator